jgi:hypothetical protein
MGQNFELVGNALKGYYVHEVNSEVYSRITGPAKGPEIKTGDFVN